MTILLFLKLFYIFRGAFDYEETHGLLFLFTFIGPDWRWENQDGGVGCIGTVYRLKNDATVYVS